MLGRRGAGSRILPWAAMIAGARPRFCVASSRRSGSPGDVDETPPSSRRPVTSSSLAAAAGDQSGGLAFFASITKKEWNHSPAWGAPVAESTELHLMSNRGAFGSEVPSESPPGLTQK